MAANLKQLSSALRAHALALPEAWEDHPWGENVAKVGKKVFVFFGVPDARGEELVVCVKLPHSGVAALDRDCCEPAGYGMGKHGWVMAKFGASEAPELALLKAWIDESYRAIAPKKLVAELDGAPARKRARGKRK